MALTSAKVLVNNPATGGMAEVAPTVVSPGAAAAGQAVGLDPTGKLDASVLPVGIGPSTAILTASEALSAGALVNVWSNAGVFSARNADNSATGKEAHGFVVAAAAAGAPATVYFADLNNQLSALTPGIQFLGPAGTVVGTAPIGTGKVVQRVGLAVSATTLDFEPMPPILLA